MMNYLMNWWMIFSSVAAAILVCAFVGYEISTSKWYCKKIAKISKEMTEELLKDYDK